MTTTENRTPESELPAWKVPGALYLLIMDSLGRLPQAMSALALVTFVRDTGGPYNLAGIVTAVYVLCAAIGQPYLGKRADLVGARNVLRWTALVGSLSFLGIMLFGAGNPLILVVCSALAGLATPPLESCLRAIWPRIMKTSKQLNSAFSMDLAAQEFLYILGPVITAFAIMVLGASQNLMLMIVLTLVGSFAFAQHPLASYIPAPTEEARVSPLKTRMLQILIVFQLYIGIPVGTVPVIASSYSELHGAAIYSGILLGVNGIGGFIGTIWIGRRPFKAPLEISLRWTAVGFGIAFLSLLALGAPFWVYCLASALAGAGFPMALTQVFMLVQKRVPENALNEANAWVVGAVGVGIAAGTWLCGVFIDALGINAGVMTTVLVSAACAALGGLLLLAGQRRP